MSETQNQSGAGSAVVMKNGTCISCGRSFRGNQFDNVCSDVCHAEMERTEGKSASAEMTKDDFSILGADKKAYREFCLFFEEKDAAGAPYGRDELIEKALELGLPLPMDVKYIRGREMTPGGIYRLPRIMVGGRWFWIDERLKEYRSADQNMLTVFNEDMMSEIMEAEEFLDSTDVPEEQKEPLRDYFRKAVNGEAADFQAFMEAGRKEQEMDGE